jgi:N-methylhydantoinase B
MTSGQKRTDEMSDIGKVDAVTARVIAGRLEAITDEMAHKLTRMSYSSIIRESEDFGCALLDHAGQQIAETLMSTPLQSGPIPGYVQGILRRYEEIGQTIQPGDVIMHNHAYYGASHGPDVAMVVPVFHEDTLVGYSATTAHHLDIGALSPGSVGIVDAADAYAEGLQFNGIKVYEAGEKNTWVWQLLNDNIRVPRLVIGDMEAQIAAAHVGAQRYLELIGTFGLETVKQAGQELLDYSESIMRNRIRQLPDGTYRAEGLMDGFEDGDEGQTRLKIAVAVTVDDDSIVVDLTGTSPQVSRPFNMPFVGTVDIAVYVVLRSMLLDSDQNDHVPANSGLYRPITIICPEGALANPRFPAPVISRYSGGNVLAGALARALAPVLPQNTCAGVGNLKILAYSGLGEDGYWVYMDITEGSYGGRFGKDGLDAVDTLYANTRNNPIEDIEAHYPLRVERYELRDAAPGPGKWRGGFGSIRDVRFLSKGGASVEGDGNNFAPVGIFGGDAGKTGALVVNPDTDDERHLPAMSAYQAFSAGTVLRTLSPCGGGYGAPFDRDPKLVLADVLDEHLSIDEAAGHYGVVVDPETFTVLVNETKELRSRASV